jgi:hypothetical protein
VSSTYTVGLDLGQRQDPSALIVIERVADATGEAVAYHCRGLERWHLGTPYPEVIARTRHIMDTPQLRESPLVIDQTGVGVAVVDMFRLVLDRVIVPVNITGGKQCSRLPNGDWSVPKFDLVAVIQSLMGRRLLRFPRGHRLAKVLVDELRNFKVKVTAAANETFMGREGANDDMVLSLAVAAWYADRAGAVIDNAAAASSGKSLLADAPAGVFGTERRPQRLDGGYQL